ncbi:DUF5344 family protein [Metabacillus iocasae]|uniref:Type VII secretion effector (TIGR04197 family) n=1 Tax=Priestia iocasae TaxID=2291674 RepID=A0ABS2QUX0_9BACI|nr:DUF5344 family protein [Metabacillus iocasae]MBM7703281.1 type VII secretion effector (TIGR04197 family) [Metabacillus iocasae]
MSKQIKVNNSEVEKALSNLRASVDNLTYHTNATTIDSNLEVLNKLSELNQSLVELSKRYTTLLTASIDVTQTSITSLKEADHTISSSIKSP